MDLSVKVARRFVAETLTRRWLMGVRKGWISLLKPSISDYDDVFKAVGRLQVFVKNFEAQIYNVRRGPLTSISGDLRATKLKKALDALKEALSDAQSKVTHWADAYNGTGLAGLSPRMREDGEKMLRLYSTNFEEALSSYKTVRGKTRSTTLTELFSDVLKPLYEDADLIQEHNESHPDVTLDVTQDVFKEFAIGSMKVVILDEKTNGASIHQYVKYCDKAHQALKAKGFGKVWYGATLITLGEYRKLPDHVQEAYAQAGYKDLHSVAGLYHSGKDVIELSNPPRESVWRTLVHEMGHRYWFKFMTPAKRAKFEMLIEGTFTKVHTVMLNIDELGLSDEDKKEVAQAYKRLEQGAEPSSEVKARIDLYYDQLGFRAGVPLVSEYAKSSVAEAFAEVFERYVIEAELTRPQVESFRAVISSTDPWKTASPLMDGEWA